MVFVRRTAIRAPVYAGDGLFSSIRKLGKTVAKVVKSPVGKVARKIYNKTLAPIAKRALVAAVGEKAANSLENAGKRTLNGENIDEAFTDEAKNLAKNEIERTLGIANIGSGMRVGTTRSLRTSDILRTKPQVIKTIKPRASAVMQRIAQEGNGLEEDTVL